MKRAIHLTILFLLVCGPALASRRQTAALRLPPFSKTQLGNGMTLLLMEQHEVPVVSFNFIVKPGSVTDPLSKDGVASLTADLLRKGTRSRSADEIASELDFIGGEFDIAASADFIGGSAEFLRKDMQRGIDVLSDMMMNPTFPEEELRKLVTQRIDSIKSAKDRADSVIARYFNRYFYGNHPYGRPVGGDETSLKNVTRSDVQTFYETHYVPANVILAVSGDFKPEEMETLIAQRFGEWVAKSAPAVRLADPAPVRGRRLLLIDKPDSTQTYFYIGNLGISRTHPDRVEIGIMNTLFGGRFTSRLNTALRTDTGLTYGARSVFDQRKLAGPFMITTYTRNATTEKAIDMTLELLKSFHENGITEDELLSARNYVKGQFPTSIETSSQLASLIARLEFYGLDESDINAYYEKVDSMSPADAQRIIKEYFPLENLVFVLIGKASEIESVARKYAPVVDRKSISDVGF
jgi:zinc protease